MLAAVAFVAAGCVNEEPPYKEEPKPTPGDATGFLSVSGLSMRVVYDETDVRPDDTSDQTQSPQAVSGTRAEQPDVDGFIVEILDADNAQVFKKTYAELKQQLAEADVETVTDQNGLQAIKVTFPGGILFPTNGTTLSANAKTELAQFANSLRSNPNTDVQIYGFTDNTGSMEVNPRVSNGRAAAVESFLANSGIAPTRLRAQGIPMADYVASNETAAGRAQNRRVEIYITADAQMIQQANNGTLK